MTNNNKLSLLWPYVYYDKTTWKYIDFKLSRVNSKKAPIKWIKNPRFNYKHLDVNNLKD